MNGAIYIATGLEHYEYAIHSISTLRKVSNIPVTLFTDVPYSQKTTRRVGDIDIQIIESVKTDQDHTRDKVFLFQQSPYQTTLFIDADTEVYEDPESLFHDEAYDIFITRAPKLNTDKKEFHGYWPGYSTALFIYNKNPLTDYVFDQC